jgi:nucleotidyltransferase/DNA polymerase involved in DNA repair
MRIVTIGDLADYDPTLLERRLGSFAPILWEMAHGRDRRLVDPERQRKSCGEECTFDRDQRDGVALRRSIIEHADAVARRLRADGSRGRTVTLKLKLAQRIGPGKYPILTRSATLPAAVDDGKSIGDAALALWEAVHGGRTVRLIGVSVSGIDTDGAAQLSLFEAPASHRRAALNRAVDSLVARFGGDAIRRGTARRR